MTAMLMAQGDLLIERVSDVVPSGVIAARDSDGACVLAEGEVTGHRHSIFEQVTFFRDDGLARDMPSDLYIGHVKVDGPQAYLVHDEHDAIPLPRGTYRVRRQRQLDPRDVQLVAD